MLSVPLTALGSRTPFALRHEQTAKPVLAASLEIARLVMRTVCADTAAWGTHRVSIHAARSRGPPAVGFLLRPWCCPFHLSDLIDPDRQMETPQQHPVNSCALGQVAAS